VREAASNEGGVATGVGEETTRSTLVQPDAGATAALAQPNRGSASSSSTARSAASARCGVSVARECIFGELAASAPAASAFSAPQVTLAAAATSRVRAGGAGHGNDSGDASSENLGGGTNSGPPSGGGAGGSACGSAGVASACSAALAALVGGGPRFAMHLLRIAPVRKRSVSFVLIPEHPD
jgi:hypothetical protein